METTIPTQTQLEAPDYPALPARAGQGRAEPLLGEVMILLVALVTLVRAQSLPKAIFSIIKNVLLLPVMLLSLVMQAVAMVVSLLSLLAHSLSIVKAAASLMVVAAIVARLQTRLSALRVR